MSCVIYSLDRHVECDRIDCQLWSKHSPGVPKGERDMSTHNTKRNLALVIAEEVNVQPHVVLEIIQKLFDHLTKGLVDGERFEFRNFGVFETATRKSRVGRNPRQPANSVVIPERRVVKFKPGKHLRGLSLPPKAPLA